MDDLDKPDLALWIYEKIEDELHKIDKSYWHELRGMCVFKFADTILPSQLNPPFPPPKRPVHLLAMLSSYARNLFYTEASEYPRDPHLAHWLGKLAERTRRRVMDTVSLLEGEGLNGLAYHGLKVTEMTQTIDGSLQLATEEQFQKVRDEARPIKVANPYPRITAAAPSTDLVSKQIDDLRNECHLTVEDLAEAVGLSIRSVYRHLSSAAQPRQRHLSAYEKSFSARLKRQVHLNVSKRQKQT